MRKEIDWKEIVRFYRETGMSATTGFGDTCILGQYLNNRIDQECSVDFYRGAYYVTIGQEYSRPATNWETFIAEAFDDRFVAFIDIPADNILAMIRESVGVEAYDDYIAELDAAMEKELVHA